MRIIHRLKFLRPAMENCVNKRVEREDGKNELTIPSSEQSKFASVTNSLIATTYNRIRISKKKHRRARKGEVAECELNARSKRTIEDLWR